MALTMRTRSLLRKKRVSRVRKPRLTRPATKAVKKIVKKSLVNLAEKKFADSVSVTGTDIDYNGTAMIPLTDFAQGDADNNSRDGDQVLPVSMEYNFQLRYNTNATPSLACNHVRLLIIRWKPFFADNPPTVGKIMTYTTTKASSVLLTHDGRKQFNVLVDRMVTLDAVSNPYPMLRGSIALKQKVQWKAASTTNVSNGIYAFLISDATAGGGVYPSYQWFAMRLHYNDS